MLELDMQVSDIKMTNRTQFALFCCLLICLTLTPRDAVAEGKEQRIAKGPIVIDVLAGLEWMRCSIGQVWSDGACVGEPLRGPYRMAQATLERAEASSGPGWRLPTRAELRELIEMNAKPPMIDETDFPETYAGSYWTGDNNRLLRGNHWVVNFYTGQSYGRALREQVFAVRLVRDR